MPTLKESNTNRFIDGIIGLVEMVFPERVRAYYLTGSYAEGTAVSHSDLDLIIIFKGACQPEEAKRLQQLGHYASNLTAMRLDLISQYEDDLLTNGATSLKLAGKFLRGTDILDQIPSWGPPLRWHFCTENGLAPNGKRSRNTSSLSAMNGEPGW